MDIETVTSETGVTAEANQNNNKEESRHYNPGPVVRETGIPGVKLDFNCGARLSVPENSGYHVRITDQDAMVVLLDADLAGGVSALFFLADPEGFSANTAAPIRKPVPCRDVPALSDLDLPEDWVFTVRADSPDAGLYELILSNR